MARFKVISGGQSGVDRAALDSAMELGIECSGWCPRGRLAEDGPIPDHYPLTETESPRYEERTELNVIQSDATLIVTTGRLEGGTRLTLETALQHGKPCLVFDLRHPQPMAEIADQLCALGVTVLNIAGPRASKQPEIVVHTRKLLLQLLPLLVANES